MDYHHIYPLNDLRPHDTENKLSCWCNPFADDERPNLIIHNSMDGREDFETGKRRFS